MPIEDIQIVKAPKDWTPSSDQRRRIQEDARLRSMSRDDQYAFFNKKAIPGRTAPANQSRAQPRRAQAAESGGIFGWVDRVQRALSGR